MDTPQSTIKFSWENSRKIYLFSSSSIEIEKSLSLSQTIRMSKHIATITYSMHILPEKKGRTLPKQLTTAFLKLPRNFYLNGAEILNTLSLYIFSYLHISWHVLTLYFLPELQKANQQVSYFSTIPFNWETSSKAPFDY